MAALDPMGVPGLLTETIRPFLFRATPQSNEDFSALRMVRSVCQRFAKDLERFLPRRPYSTEELQAFRQRVFERNLDDAVPVFLSLMQERNSLWVADQAEAGGTR